MIKNLTLLCLLILLTGCGRTFVMQEPVKKNNNHLLVSSYSEQNIQVKETVNWHLGETQGIGKIKPIDANNQDADFEVFFNFNEFVLTDVEKERLNNFLSNIDENKSIVLVGKADEIGTEDANYLISTQRAFEVKKHIENKTKLKVTAYGSGVSAYNLNEEERNFNRKVGVYIYE